MFRAIFFVALVYCHKPRHFSKLEFYSVENLLQSQPQAMNSSFHVTSFLLETFTRSSLRSMTVTSIENFLVSKMF
jgi:hypothetical protein